MGASGSGKSTLMNILGCLDQPTSGQLRPRRATTSASCDDDDAVARSAAGSIGFIFQNFNLIQQLTVLENLEVPMFYLGIPPHERAHARDGAGRARRAGPSALDHRPMQLSGGQQQRVCIARAMVNEPLILLADEPTGALDSKTGQQILELFDELVAAGKTIILVTHDPSVAHRCHRVIQLHDGKVARDERSTPHAVHVEGGQFSS